MYNVNFRLYTFLQVSIDSIKENVMGGTCSTHRKAKYIQKFLSENMKESDYL